MRAEESSRNQGSRSRSLMSPPGHRKFETATVRSAEPAG